MRQMGLCCTITSASMIASRQVASPGVTSPTANNGNGGFSAHVRMLSFLEQQPLYNAANFSINRAQGAVGAYMNSTLVVTRLSVFLCPSSVVPSWTYPAAVHPVHGSGHRQQLLRLNRGVPRV